MTERSYIVLVLEIVSSAIHVLTQVFPFPGSTKEQSPHSTPAPWDPLRAVSWKLSVSSCETASSPPEESQTCICLPATLLQAVLLLAGVGEPGFLWNQEEK